MLLIKALAILMASFSYVPVSAGALNTSLIDFASHSYLNGNLELSSSQRKELDCLTKVVWYEARGESRHNKKVVANVVRNRTQFGKPFATTVCDVVYQRNQFAWTRDFKKKHAEFKKVAKNHMDVEQKQVLDTVSVAMEFVLMNPTSITKATHFCTATEKCNFKNVRRLGQVGNLKYFEYLGNP